MGIFDKKQDGVQTITPDGADSSSSSDTTPVAESTVPQAAVTTDPSPTPSATDDNATSTAPTLEELENSKDNITKIDIDSSATEPVDNAETNTDSPKVEDSQSADTEPEPVQGESVPEAEPFVPSPEPTEPAVANTNTTHGVDIKPISQEAGAVDDTDSSSDELSTIKREAIEKLSPLVELLDQTPEEKFHTTMMLLQSTDDKDLIKKAYDSAQQIPDDKIKAQALLDVVNEINYYTQEQPSD